jgi:hydroxymethylpyrimidine/phosphomethylpyrimidine kinase
VLCVAGTDSGGGAGLAADVRTAAALGCHPLLAVTAVTAQNSLGVAAVGPVPGTLIRSQIEAALGDIGADAVKIGMLGGAPAVRAVADALARFGARGVVLDPVLRATTGTALLDARGLALLVARLLPLADLVTPNLAEAAALLGRPVRGAAGMRAAAAGVLALGARAVLIKGGHLRGAPVDLFADAAGRLALLRGERVPTRHTHGTGCVLSTAIACLLARGEPLPDAVRGAKRFVTRAIRDAYPLGAGAGTIWPRAHAPGAR